MAERWLQVAGYEGLYEVSDAGNVRRVRRQTEGRVGVTMTFADRDMLGTVTKAGYRRVSLTRNGKRRHWFVHDLVLEAFVGPRPERQEGCHGNGDGLDNRLANLRWDTRSENQRDSVRHGTHSETKKTHCPQGHPYDEANTYRASRGSRNCRACGREATARWAQKERTAA